MTRDDIIRMAREAGLLPNYEVYDEDLTRFAKLVYEKAWADTALAATHTITDAAILKEREACAKVCDALAKATHPNEEQVGPGSCAAAIRARSNP